MRLRVRIGRKAAGISPQPFFLDSIARQHAKDGVTEVSRRVGIRGNTFANPMRGASAILTGPAANLAERPGAASCPLVNKLGFHDFPAGLGWVLKAHKQSGRHINAGRRRESRFSGLCALRFYAWPRLANSSARRSFFRTLPTFVFGRASINSTSVGSL
jgi:hypothetical protein